MRKRSVVGVAALVVFLPLAVLEIWSGTGYAPTLLALLCTIILGSGGAFAASEQNVTALKALTTFTAVFAAGVFLLFADTRLNLWWGERNANTIVAAYRAYESKRGTLPPSLAFLVPDYLPRVSRAKLLGGVTQGNYEYCVADGDHRLSYVIFAPHLRRIYRFESGAWTVSDSHADTRGPGAICRWPERPMS